MTALATSTRARPDGLLASLWRPVAGPLAAIRRGGLAWLVSIAALVAVTVAFWPSFRGTSALSEMFDQMPSGLTEALGLADFGTPAGFLRGNLYAFFVQLLLAGAAIGFANGLTASEEDSGRLELALAEPISRQAAFLGRVAAATIWLLALTLALTVAQFAADAAFDLAVPADRLLATIVLSALLGLIHGALAFAIAGASPRPSLVLGVSLVVLLAGCTINTLFPLSGALKPWVHISPWDWALAGDPLTHPTEAWRYLALAVPSVVLVAFGTIAFCRRDVRAA